MATEKSTTEVAVPDTWVSAVAFQRQSYEALLNQPEGTLDSTTGRALVDKESLIDSPHIITGCVFREGMSEFGFVSVEAVTANDVDIVYNDSGTGIMEGLSDYLSFKGIIAGRDPNRASVRGPAWQDWKILDTNRAAIEVSKSGKTSLHVVGIALHVRNGLRKSEYTFEAVGPNGKPITGDAVTYYLN